MKICTQSSGVIEHWGYEDGYRMIAEAGFQGLDWNIADTWNQEKIVKEKKLEHCIFEDSLAEITAHYQQELDIIRKNNLQIVQAHAPFPAYVKDFPEFNDYAVGIYKQCIRFCNQLGIKNLVIHGISLAIGDDTQTPESIHAMNLHLYESLIPVLQETNVVVCLENLFTQYGNQVMEGTCSIPEEAIWYIDYLNEKAGKECFGLCLDTGHLNLLGKNQKSYLCKLGKRIKALHLHDNMGMVDDHLAPYTGNIVWKDVLEGLKEIGYSGDLNFETFRQVTLSRVDAEVVPIWLKAIYGFGETFKNKLEM